MHTMLNLLQDLTIKLSQPMMKSLLFANFTFMFPKSLKLLSMGWLMMTLSLSYSFNLGGAFSLCQDMVTVSLSILSCWIVFLMMPAQNKSSQEKLLGFTYTMLLLSLMYSFTTSSVIMFYFFFEWSLIPIFAIILGWGYQPERLKAGMCLMFYTLFSSLPLLIMILLMQSETFSMFFYYLSLSQSLLSSPQHIILTISLILTFLVKFPMWGVHLWLPKAHVEAPVAGSMVLAGVLLKLGGYGLIRLSTIFTLSVTSYFIISLSLVGGGILGIMCTVVGDMKVVIAYSSVVHMALIIAGLMSLHISGTAGGAIIMIAHGICSSGLFVVANMMYERTHSRALSMNKGGLSLSPQTSVMWFLLLMANFGGPFTLNLLGEIILILNLTQISPLTLMSVCLLSFFSAAYSLILYSSSQQGMLSGSKTLSNVMSVRESNTLTGHVWPLMALCLSPFMY